MYLPECSAHGGQQRAADALELEPQTVASLRAGAGSQHPVALGEQLALFTHGAIGSPYHGH